MEEAGQEITDEYLWERLRPLLGYLQPAERQQVRACRHAPILRLHNCSMQRLTQFACHAEGNTASKVSCKLCDCSMFATTPFPVSLKGGVSNRDNKYHITGMRPNFGTLQAIDAGIDIVKALQAHA